MEVTQEEDIIKLATKDSAVDMEASAVVDTREVSVDTREDTIQLSTIQVSAAVDTREVSVDTREVSAAADTTREVLAAADTTKEVSPAADSVDTREVSTDN